MFRPIPKATGIIIALIALPVLSGLFLWFSSLRTDPEILSMARSELRARRYLEAEAEALRIDSDSPLFIQAMLIAGEAATRRNELEQALEYYRQIQRESSADGLRAAAALANVAIHTGQLTEALDNFQFVLQHRPEDLASHSRVAFLYAAAARSQQARPHLEILLKSGSATAQELALLSDLQRPVDEREFLLKSRVLVPSDPQTRLGLAASDLLDGDVATARSALDALLLENPSDLDAAALLLELLAELPGDDFNQLDRRLHAAAASHPDIWFARGVRLRRQHPATAVRCFLETLAIAPFHRRACYQLSRLLTETQHPAAADFAQLAADLFTLSNALKRAADSDARDQDSLKTIVRILDQQGRVWETCAWAQLARHVDPTSSWADPYLQRLAPLLSQELPMVRPQQSPVRLLAASDFPDYRPAAAPNARPSEWPAGSRIPASTSSPSQPPLKFQEITAIGLDFTCISPTDPSTRGQRMQEQTGGGIAVLDLDLDGWPDIHCTQASPWPTGSPQPLADPQFPDRLFRNLRGSRFDDVTASSGIFELGFSQGVAVGDLNQDGFDDLYVANIGPNSLWLSNGDGTFTPHALPAPATPLRWCSSCAITDLNNDALPDLVDINYVSGSNVYSLICNGRACSPSTFTGTLPEVHISQGDGSFQMIAATVPVADSKGLGILIYRDAPDLPPSIFVANDQTPKFLLTPEIIDGRLQLIDQASRTGLAFNGDGVLTAAMGIAAADLDSSGTTDFFVTNFRDEPNTLYLQLAPGLFQDVSRTSGLDAPGLPYVGWGAQFLDADRDGDQDLVTVNGHIEDYRDTGGDFEMRPQLFRNQGQLQFEEVTAEEAGPWLARKSLGRALATLDWNQDGRMDFIAGNINSPVALVENQSSPIGPGIQLQLHAVSSDRDAWFTSVVLDNSQTQIREQLRAGSGYHASSQRVLQLTPGASPPSNNATNGLTLSVTWPNGKVVSITNVPSDCRLHLVENRSDIYVVPK
ncbi:MAG: FG-GAP-like repeat-containing protein [Planctomycetaceae bacterium]